MESAEAALLRGAVPRRARRRRSSRRDRPQPAVSPTPPPLPRHLVPPAQQGNSVGYAARRLQRRRPDLYQRGAERIKEAGRGTVQRPRPATLISPTGSLTMAHSYTLSLDREQE